MVGMEANSYASGLYKLAIENEKISSFQEEMKEVRDLIRENPTLFACLTSYSLPDESLYALVDKIFGHLKNKEITAFIRLLVKKHEIIHIEDIASSFNKLCNEKEGIKEGILYSPSLLTNKEIENIEKAMQKRLGFAVSLENHVDPSLLGGVKVFIDDKVYDGTILGKIERLRSTLLK